MFPMIKILLTLASALFGYLRERQLISVGEQKQMNATMKEVLHRGKIAKEIRNRGDELPDDWLHPKQGNDK